MTNAVGVTELLLGNRLARSTRTHRQKV